MLAGAVQNYSLGGLREVPGGQKIALGEVRDRPGGGREAPKSASGGEKASKSVQEPSWSRKRQSKRFRVTPFGEPGAACGEALGSLGGAFLGDVVAHRFCIDFSSIFRRFWDGFWYQKSKKKRSENEANFGVFF